MASKIVDFIKRNKRLLFYVLIGLQIVFLLGMAGTRLLPLVFGKTILLEPIPVDPNDFFRGEYVRLRYDISSITVDELPGDGYIGVLLKKEDSYWNFERALKKGEAIPPSETDKIFMRGRVIQNTEVQIISLADFGDVSSPGWIAAHTDEINRMKALSLSPLVIRGLQKDATLYIPLSFSDFQMEWNVQDWDVTTDLDKLKRYDTDIDNAIVSARVTELHNGYKAEVEYGIESWFVPEGEALNYEQNMMGRMTIRVSVDSSGNAVINKVLVDGKPVSY
jgi:uncharacterized membrane-anchored protein